jgi:hypothetical protein
MTDPSTLPPCPRCHQLAGVEEEENAGSSRRWFICRLCGHCWSAAPEGLR